MKFFRSAKIQRRRKQIKSEKKKNEKQTQSTSQTPIKYVKMNNYSSYVRITYACLFLSQKQKKKKKNDIRLHFSIVARAIVYSTFPHPNLWIKHFPFSFVFHFKWSHRFILISVPTDCELNIAYSFPFFSFYLFQENEKQHQFCQIFCNGFSLVLVRVLHLCIFFAWCKKKWLQAITVTFLYICSKFSFVYWFLFMLQIYI